jgi:hypothetical protein
MEGEVEYAAGVLRTSQRFGGWMSLMGMILTAALDGRLIQQMDGGVVGNSG